MKKFTKFSIAAMTVALGWGFYQDQFRGDENAMEDLHRRAAINQVDCTKTEGLADHTWLACRWAGEDDYGSIWLQLEDDSGPIWLARNGKAIQAVERYQNLPAGEQSSQIRVRLTTPEDTMQHNLLGLLDSPWDHLN